MYTVFDKKVKEKWNKDHIELHKRVITTYLMQRGLTISKRNKFFALYDMLIDPSNILLYFNRPVKIFVQALVLDQLSQISDYITHDEKRKRNHRSTRKKTKG